MPSVGIVTNKTPMSHIVPWLRANHPPIAAGSVDFVQLWIDKGRPLRDMPWSRSFSIRVATGEEKIPDFDPDNFPYSGDPLADAERLPRDPAMAADKLAALQADPMNINATRHAAAA